MHDTKVINCSYFYKWNTLRSHQECALAVVSMYNFLTTTTLGGGIQLFKEILRRGLLNNTKYKALLKKINSPGTYPRFRGSDSDVYNGGGGGSAGGGRGSGNNGHARGEGGRGRGDSGRGRGDGSRGPGDGGGRGNGVNNDGGGGSDGGIPVNDTGDGGGRGSGNSGRGAGGAPRNDLGPPCYVCIGEFKENLEQGRPAFNLLVNGMFRSALASAQETIKQVRVVVITVFY